MFWCIVYCSNQTCTGTYILRVLQISIFSFVNTKLMLLFFLSVSIMYLHVYTVPNTVGLSPIDFVVNVHSKLLKNMIVKHLEFSFGKFDLFVGSTVTIIINYYAFIDSTSNKEFEFANYLFCIKFKKGFLFQKCNTKLGIKCNILFIHI